MKNEDNIYKYKSRRFFNTEFPFFIRKFTHSSQSCDGRQVRQREFWKIIYVLEGDGWKIINKKRYPLSPGCLFLIHPDDKTSFAINSESITIYNILFLPELIQFGLNELNDDFNFFSIFQQNFYDNISVDRRGQLYVLESKPEIEYIIKKMNRVFIAEKVNYQSLIKLQLLELLVLISQQSSRALKKSRKKDIVKYINLFLKQHYTQEISLSLLANEVHLNKTYLSRIFKEETGMRVMELLLQQRIQAASDALINSKATISEVCYNSGFNDLSYFYRAFKKSQGLNPGDYRKKFGQN
jgi:AraC-like DNA-binding protein